jgi:hypothetical protein
MAAGLGFKTFNTGEVLTAGDTNGYLMQGILVFATEAARDAAITVPAEGQFAFTKDNNTTWFYDGAAWVVSGATGDITAVTAGTGISGGGASGDVTVTNSMATAYTTKGDLVPATGSAAFSRLAVGANDTILTADSTAATGMKWAAAAGGGGANWSLLNAGGTSLTSTVTTISGISNVENIFILIRSASSSTANAQYRVRINGDTGNNYSYGGPKLNAGATYNVNNYEYSAGTLDGPPLFGIIGSTASSDANGFFEISGGKNTGIKVYNFSSGSYSGSGGQVLMSGGGVYAGSAAITSVAIATHSGSFDNGTIFVYGA